MQATYSLNSNLFFMDERDRNSTQRSYFCHENGLPLKIPYEMAKEATNSLTVAWAGISASHQLSASEMQELFEQFPRKQFIVVDLREESHFFLNGFPVSLTNKTNTPNLGKQLPQIKEDEESIVQTFKQSAIPLHTRVKSKEVSNGAKVRIVDFLPQAPILPETMETEEALVTRLKGTYVRIPVTDGGFPSEDHIDKLVSLYEIQSLRFYGRHRTQFYL